ncbi:MFS transporter [Kribbella deserti]|uniref:MFS transporter n=1 Tax=Kribbella deserti TaxID=1926257 RepID=A0ABV6QRT9_9ACTN
MSDKTTSAPVAVAAGPDPRRWRALAILCAAYFMIIIDSQIVVLALPTIDADLGLGAGGAQWVMSSYLLAFGSLLLLGGRTADLFGGRRMFLIGTALFLVASMGCGLATSSGVLIVARVIQGVAAAVMAPTAMAVLMTTFEQGPERNRAVGIWSGIGAFGATAALLVGGSITDGLGWQWIFFINVPIALLVLVSGPRLLRETPYGQGAWTLDPIGAVTITGALVLLVFAVVTGPDAGWASARTVALLLAALAALALFVAVERKVAAPLVPPRIFRNGTLVAGNLMTLLVCIALYGAAYNMSVYAQQVLGYSPTRFGLSTAVYAALSIIGSNVAGALIAKVGYARVGVVGAGLLTVGAFLLSRVSADGNYWTDLFPGLVVIGSGIGTTVVAGAVAALSNVNGQEAGLASGINNSVFQIGAALGIAISTTVALMRHNPAAEPSTNLIEGVRSAFLAATIAAFACLLVATTLTLRRRR